MIRIVVTGSECTGKTTLAEALAEHCGTVFVPEYVRQFVLAKGAPPEAKDCEAIAHGQIALEDEMAKQLPDLLIQDTDLLSTVVYSRHYYGECPQWIDDALQRRAADLYLLCGIDVPWAPDGNQRDRGNRREEMQGLFRQALIDRDFSFAEISGDQQARLQLAVSAIDRLSPQARTCTSDPQSSPRT